jgi:hypothetical protein
MFTPFSEKSAPERAAIARREKLRKAAIEDAATFVRTNPSVRSQAFELSLLSEKYDNENWPPELSKQWRCFRHFAMAQFKQCPSQASGLLNDLCETDRLSYFVYGLQFIEQKLRQGTFEFGT